jgi:PqqA peptide cyclase
MGVLHVGLSGGEPLLRPDLEDLVTAASNLGLYTNLITSAVGLTQTRASRLKSAGLDSVQISFQADDACLADKIAGARVHGMKLDASKAVAQSKIPLSLNVVLHRANIDRVDAIIDLAEKLNADRLELANVQFYGWAMLNTSQLLPSHSQIQRASDSVHAAKHRLANRMELVYVMPDYFSGRPKPCMNGWGQRHITVNPAGDVLPCPSAGVVRGLRFENVRHKPLNWIWEHSDAFNKFRGEEWMLPPCRTCEFRNIDFGGCRCQAQLIAGDANATDPACIHSLQHDRMSEAQKHAAGNVRWDKFRWRRSPSGLDQHQQD